MLKGTSYKFEELCDGEGGSRLIESKRVLWVTLPSVVTLASEAATSEHPCSLSLAFEPSKSHQLLQLLYVGFLHWSPQPSKKQSNIQQSL